VINNGENFVDIFNHNLLLYNKAILNRSCIQQLMDIKTVALAFKSRSGLFIQELLRAVYTRTAQGCLYKNCSGLFI
jgi:hypothetical protein